MGHVADRIIDLALVERTARPVGKTRAFIEVMAKDAFDEIGITDLFAIAECHRCDLRIEKRIRHFAGQIMNDFEVLAPGVEDLENADAQLVRRLAGLIKHTPHHGKHRLLAFDKNYRPDGSVNLEKTEFYVPNEYVFSLAQQSPELFVPNISVHPYRPDALQELEKWAGRGARIVKWLPNAMGIDPSYPRCDPFYEKMRELNLILLSHGGEEKAVQAKEDQKLGNPLLLRLALDHEVKVIVAHCAGLGENEDLDDRDNRLRSNFDLFMRLMEDKKYEGLIFGEISAMTQFNRCGVPLATILEREDFHERLVNGSDYPLPAVNILVRTVTLLK